MFVTNPNTSNEHGQRAILLLAELTRSVGSDELEA